MLAILYRMVGGFIGLDNTCITRLRWAIPMGAFMAYASIVHHEETGRSVAVFVLCTVMAYLGRLIPHAAFQASASIYNSLCMAAIGMARLALIVAPYATADWHRMGLVVFGAFQGLAYYIGWTYLHNLDSGIYFRNTRAQWHIKPYFYDPVFPASAIPNPAECLDQAAVSGAEWGELLTGMLVYQLMYIVMLVMS